MKRIGPPYGLRNIGPARQAFVARLLLDGTLTKNEIARVTHVTYDQVRTVQRNLELLNKAPVVQR